MKHPSRLTGAAALAAAAALIPTAALGAAPAAAPTAGPAIPTTPISAAITPAPAPATASATACATPGLVIWLDTQGNGTAGSVFYTLELTNLSGHTCTLRGYPGVSAVNLAGHTVGSAASRDHSTTPHNVTLAPGAAGNFPPATCHQVTAAGLRVFPPGQTASKIVPFPFAACSSTGPVYLSVRAVRHG
jgi:hypothetical protein